MLTESLSYQGGDAGRKALRDASDVCPQHRNPTSCAILPFSTELANYRYLHNLGVAGLGLSQG